MATRLDRARPPMHRTDDRRSTSPVENGVPEREGSAETPLPPRLLGGAMASWLALTFGLCSVVLPSVAAITGVYPDLVTSFWYQLPAFAIAAFVATIGALVERPRFTERTAGRDPILAATIGGFAVWAVVQNVSPGLTPFAELGLPQLVTLLGIKLVETTLLGTMFASFTRRTDVALALGGGFQLGVLGLLLTLMSLLAV